MQWRWLRDFFSVTQEKSRVFQEAVSLSIKVVGYILPMSVFAGENEFAHGVNDAIKDFLNIFPIHLVFCIILGIYFGAKRSKSLAALFTVASIIAPFFLSVAVCSQASYGANTHAILVGTYGACSIVSLILVFGSRKNDKHGDKKRVAKKQLDINSEGYVRTSQETPITDLMLAASRGDEEAVKKLIAGGADINARSNDDATALMFAAVKGSQYVAYRLIQAGANLNAKKKDGVTALMIASSLEDPAVARLLIKSGADVNAQAENGEDALIRAEKANRPKIVQLLRSGGA